MPAKKKPKRPRTNEEKKRHFMNMLRYAVMNEETLSAEPDLCALRTVAYNIHCTQVGVRLRYDNRDGNDEVIEAFNRMIMWRDLLTAKQCTAGDLRYESYVTQVQSYARPSERGGEAGGQTSLPATIPEEGVLPASSPDAGAEGAVVEQNS